MNDPESIAPATDLHQVAAPAPVATPPVQGSLPNAPLVLLAAIAVVFALHWAEPFLVPVLAATFLAYTLKPIVERLYRLKVPRSIGAAFVLAVLFGGVAYAAASLRDEALTTLQELPAASRRFSNAVTGLYHRSGSTVRTVEAVARELERATREAEKLTLEPTRTAPPPVVVAAPPSTLRALVWSGSLTAMSAIGTLATSMLLLFFLLQAGDSFRRRLVRVVGTSLSSKRATVEVLNDINVQIQSYLFMLLVTNTLLALFSWGAYSLIGLDNAAIWAITAAVLHLVPYIGAMLTLAVTSVAAFTQFQSFPMTALVAGVTMGLATLVGMGLAPWMSGRQARMNPTAIFLALLFFGWLWGAWGLLLAIPIVVICKVIAERVDRLHGVAELLGD